jgi:hypothetical protein
MKTKNYRVLFFKINIEIDKKSGEEIRKEDSFLGSMNIDNNGTSDKFPLMAKAFRVAPANLALADKLKIEQL